MPNPVPLNWQQLPDGQELLVQPGYYYAVVALVDVPQSKILSMADGYGLQVLTASLEDPADPRTATPPLPPPPSGYRYVAGQAVGVRGGKTVPWSVPGPWSIFDGSTLVHAWAAPPPGAPPGPAPTLSCPSPPSRFGADLLAGAVGVLLFEGGRALLRRLT